MPRSLNPPSIPSNSQYPSLYQHSPDGMTKRLPKHEAAFKSSLKVGGVSLAVFCA